MALTITAAASGVSPVELAGPDSAAGASTGDAFAGVLAGLGQADRAGSRAQRDEPPADQADARPDADPTATADSAAAAGLAALVLAAQPVPAPPAATGSASGDEPGGPVEHTRGPAPQAAQAAQDAAARRPAQALAAQAAATAAKEARLADHSTGGPTGTEPAPASGPASSESTGGSVALPERFAGLGPVPDRTPGHGADLLGAPAAAGVPTTGSTQAAASPNASTPPAQTPPASTPPASTPPASTPPASTPEATPALAAQLAAVQATQAGAASPANRPANPANPGAQPADATPAVVTLPGTAAAIAGTSGAAKPADPAAGGKSALATIATTPAAARRAEPTPRAGHRELADPVPIVVPQPAVDPSTPAQPGILTADPSSPAQPGIPVVQASTAPAAQPANHDSAPVQRHPAADLPLADQVAGPVLALRARGDGSHQLLIALHPAELGPVNVHVRIAGDAMTISLASSSDVAHDTLRDALPQLRSELQSAGLGAASLSLDLTSGGSAGSGGFADQRQDTGPFRPAPAPVTEPVRQHPSRRPTTASNSGLDRWL